MFVPGAVQLELCHPTAPAVLRAWVREWPSWLEVISVYLNDNDALQRLGTGERAAITLALSMHADLILIDKRKRTSAALAEGFEVTGTLGILRLAARAGWIDIADTVNRLKRTNFRYRPEVIDDLLNEFSSRKQGSPE